MTDPGRIAERIAGILGGGRTRLAEPGDPESDIYAPHPLPLVHAAASHRGEVAEILRAASADGFAVVPVGGNTAPHIPDTTAGPPVLLSLELLDRTLEHDEADLTLTVEAGASVAEIAARIGPSRKLGLEPPDPDRATVGGVLAARADGPAAARLGGVADQVLGLEFLRGDGVAAKTGGRVVKNVTGYDLARIHCGGEGAFGVIVSATLRLRPVEEEEVTVLAAFSGIENALGAAGALRRGPVVPAAAAVLLGAAAMGAMEGADAVLAVRLEGTAGAVAAAVDDVARSLGDTSCWAVGRDESRSLWARASTPRSFLAAPVPAWHLRLATPFSGLADAVHAALAPRRDEDMAAVILPDTGLAHVLLAGRTDLHDAGPGVYGAIDSALRRSGGSARVDSDPRDAVRLCRRFPSLRSDAVAVLRRLRTVFDPAGVLNPGRTPLDAPPAEASP